MRDIFLNTLLELAEKDTSIMLLTGDLGYGVLDSFENKCPNQYLNVGVAEQNMTGLATGLALEGKNVFTYSIANFSTLRCLEQIRNDAAYHEVNVKIVAIGGGFSYGALGMSHHATEDLAILRALPKVTVISPSTKWETAQATRSLVNTPGVGYLRLDKSCADDNDGKIGGDFEVGKARCLREGIDITLISTGGITQEALMAAELAEQSGISCRVLSFHTIKPIDKSEILKAVRETGRLVTVEEHNINGGLGSAVAEVCMDSGIYPKYFKRIALNDVYSSVVGSQAFLKKHYKMDCAAIYNAIMNQ